MFFIRLFLANTKTKNWGSPSSCNRKGALISQFTSRLLCHVVTILCNSGLVTQRSHQQAPRVVVFRLLNLSSGITEPSQSCPCVYLSLKDLFMVSEVVTLDLLTKIRVNSWTPRTEAWIRFRNPSWPPLHLACLRRSLYNSSKGTQPRSDRNSNKHGVIMR